MHRTMQHGREALLPRRGKREGKEWSNKQWLAGSLARKPTKAFITGHVSSHVGWSVLPTVAE